MASTGRMKKDKKEADPEELMRRKFRAKCQFRALGRMVMANAYWLMEAVDHYEGVDDVKRRVAQAVRGKAKKKRLLSITDKALLNKPNSERTDLEKKYIFRIIGGLKCFKRYPNHVKKKLAAVTYFKYYRPNRVIVRQHHEAHAMYFIVTGDVIVSQMIFDELIQQYVSVDIGSMHSGDMFGEVSLLHNIPRTATCTAVGHCEMLALMKEDFKSVLQASVQKQWDEVRLAMSAFTYFDALDEVARREGCIVAKMKSYKVNDTILGDGCGIANYVYFVLSGQCQMIDTLNVSVKYRCGRPNYSLYDPYVPQEESDQDFDAKYFEAYKDKAKKLAQSSMEMSTSRSGSKRLESIIRFSETKRKSSLSTKRDSIQTIPEDKEVEHTSATTATDVSAGIVPSVTQTIPEGEVLSRQDSVKVVSREDSVKVVSRQTSMKSEVILRPDQRESIRESIAELPPLPYRTYFMQVCRYNPGSTFGFGENMRDRRIIALTPVDCMLLPKIWLLQRNTANIWTRIEHFLEKKIPTKKQLFKEYVTARRWQDFRDQLVDDVVARSNSVNYTTIHDVPYSIRMEEMLDI